MAFENLFKPIKLGPMEVKNRINLSPMNMHYSDGKGFVTEQDIAFYKSIAMGGTGLVTTGAIAATESVAEYQKKMFIMHFFDPIHIAGFQEFVEEVHEHGGKVALQFSPGFGGIARYQEVPPPAPSAIVGPGPMPEFIPKAYKKLADRISFPKVWFSHLIPRPMTVSEILKLQEDYARSCKLALNTGADSIEIHGHGGYLVHQFLSPLSNLRTDQYGGSVENRARFLTELVAKIKDAVQDRCAVAVRISADEHTPGGFTIKDVIATLKLCKKAGLDYADLSDGCYETFKYLFPEEESDHLLNEAAQIRKETGLPVITPSVHDPVHAENAVKEGKTDMIGLGRQLLADPQWPNKVQANKPQDIRKCKRDYSCLMWIFLEGRTRCTVNENLGREKYMPEYLPKRKSAKFSRSLLSKDE